MLILIACLSHPLALLLVVKEGVGVTTGTTTTGGALGEPFTHELNTILPSESFILTQVTPK